MGEDYELRNWTDDDRESFATQISEAIQPVLEKFHDAGLGHPVIAFIHASPVDYKDVTAGVVPTINAMPTMPDIMLEAMLQTALRGVSDGDYREVGLRRRS